MDQQEKFGMLMACTATLLFSFKSIIAKSAYQYGVDPLTLLHMRLYVAVPLLLATLFIRERRQVAEMTATDITKISALGTFGITVAMAASFYAIHTINASLANVLTFTYPVFTVLVLIPIAGTRPSATVWMALAVTFCGIILVSNLPVTGIDMGEKFALGFGLALTSAIAFAFYNAMSQQLLRRVSGLQMAAIGTAAAAIALIVISGFRWDPNPTVVYHVLVLGIVSGYLPFLAYPIAIKHVGATKTVITNTMGPPMTLLWAHLFLGESMSPMQLLGMALILTGVLTAGLRRQRPTPPPIARAALQTR